MALARLRLTFLRAVWLSLILSSTAQLSLAESAEAAPQPRSIIGFEEPLVSTSLTASPSDDQAANQALARWRPNSIEGLAPLTTFLAHHPDSRWRLSLQTNLGLWYYREGYFSLAIAAWEDAWATGEAAGKPPAAPLSPAARALADRAMGELIRMHARLGHSKRLKELLAAVEGRTFVGPATELVAGAKQGLWMMDNNPGVAYLCGPNALRKLALLQTGTANTPTPDTKLLARYQSGPNGVSLAQVTELSKAARLPYRPAYRLAGTPIPVPSVVHWKVSHYAAIVGEQSGRYHIQDPTFGTDLWISRDAIERESSGFFLIPEGVSSAGWRDVTLAETDQIHGMGYTNSGDPNATRPNDPKEKPSCPNSGMCGTNAHSMNVSLNLSDTPVGYSPAVGPDVHVQLTYNQREARQPSVATFFNFGPKWTSNWLGYVVDVPGRPGINTMSYVRGGGAYDEIGYSENSGKFAHEPADYSMLRLVSVDPIRYERSFRDGSTEVYASPDGSTAYPRRVFLTQVLDPAGNAVTLGYDTAMRVTQLTDAVGRITTFTYGNASFPLQPTKITDPFGRFAQIAYDSSGRLQSITDVLGLVSTMTYDAGSFVNKLTTPYGATTFSASESGPDRVLEMTDPLGYTERVESKQSAPGIPYSDPRGMPAGMASDNVYLYYRNTFYWDKHAYSLAAGDYTKAKIQHWYHDMVNGSYSSAAMASSQNPLEGRLWQRTPNDSGYYSGTYNQPWQVGRVLDDGSTQLTTILYNQTGNVASVTDPEGRYTQYSYGNGNGIDITKMRQRDAAGNLLTTAQFTYNSQHLPLTYTDAAGKVTQYTYNASGQLTSTKNALGQLWNYKYNALGQLTKVVNPNGVTDQTFTYDGFDRVATSKDSEGLTLVYAYDALDRIVSTSYLDGTTELYAYDKLDMVSRTDRLGRVTSYGYNANRELTSVTDPLSRTVSFGRYRNGTLLSLTDAKGNLTTWQRDLQGRPTSKTYADGSAETFTWEAYGARIKSHADADGRTQTYTYRRDDRVASIAYSGGTVATPTVKFAYDPVFPRLKSMTDGTGTTQYQYGATGALGALQLTGEDGPYANDDIAYGYDELGRITQRTVAGGVESVTYDALSRVTAGSNALGALTYTYLGQTNQALTRAVGSNAMTTLAYDTNANDRRLKSILNQGTRGYQYTSNAAALITGITDTTIAGAARTWTPGYDAGDRLTSESISTGQNYGYTYDSADNVTAWTTPNGNPTATFGSTNQMLKLSGATVTHDAAGNITDDSKRTYTWDAAGRLASIGYKNNALLKTDFRYDGLGRRVAIIETNDTTVTETRYLWCGATLCQARDGGDAVTRRYFAEGEYRPSNSAKYYYDRDNLGSVRNITNAANSTVQGSLDYDAYGNLIASGGTPSSTDFRYAGMFYHATSGLYLTQFRAYNPATTRWLSRDPIAEEGGLNLYAYVGGNPISYVDPTGEIAFIPILIGIGVGYAFDYALEQYKKAHCTCQDTPAGAAGNAAAGGAVGGAGRFASKPRGGIAGGGPSGTGTSAFSQMNHAAARSGWYSVATRNGITKVLRKVPYAGAALAAYEVYDAFSCD